MKLAREFSTSSSDLPILGHHLRRHGREHRHIARTEECKTGNTPIGRDLDVAGALSVANLTVSTGNSLSIHTLYGATWGGTDDKTDRSLVPIRAKLATPLSTVTLM